MGSEGALEEAVVKSGGRRVGGELRTERAEVGESVIEEASGGGDGDKGGEGSANSGRRVAREEDEAPEMVKLGEHAGDDEEAGERDNETEGREGCGGGGEEVPEEAPCQGRVAGITTEEFGR